MRHSLRWFIFIAILFCCLIVFLGASLVSSLHYENLINQQNQALQQELEARYPNESEGFELITITADVRLTYILSFIFFSLFFIGLAGYLSHLAVRRINTAIDQFQLSIVNIQSADDLKDFDAHPQAFVFQELGEAFSGVNQLARQLDTIMVDKSLLEAALNELDQENSMAAKILYGHLIEKNADNPWGISHRIQASSRFSGDIVLVRRSPTGSIFVLLADATGHGLAATITIMPVISVFDSMVKKGHRLTYILKEMNQRLLVDLPGDRFVAALVMEIDPLNRELKVWNGGMPPALLRSAEKAIHHRFLSRHMALGILDADLFDALPERVPLPQDGKLICYSDGLTEQENMQGLSFGQPKLEDLFEQLDDQHLVAGILTAAEKHAEKAIPDDDISLLLLDFEKLNTSLHYSISQAPRSINSTQQVAPFQWHIKLQGQQLINRALPAMTNDFLQTLGINQELTQQVFTLAHQLTSRALHENLLQLPAAIKYRLLAGQGEEGLRHYYRKRQEALENLNPDSFLELSLDCWTDPTTANTHVEVSVRDNGSGQAELDVKTRLQLDWCKQVEVLEAGHWVKARI
ncbi:PP2C family protein-serine/threonine phosphatase [Marinospirillum celere]|uniref:PP2C family protein-serine/threonine phosphatase n=1 Tax=Marinospirillum celere TaxID=1122252 RepID=UPI000B854A9D|nr:PP2C family protein-serine/threonine phosphatase [Marinospirillum celere]